MCFCLQIPAFELTRKAGPGQPGAQDVLFDAVKKHIKAMPAADVEKLDAHSKNVVAAYKGNTMVRSKKLISSMQKVLLAPMLFVCLSRDGLTPLRLYCRFLWTKSSGFVLKLGDWSRCLHLTSFTMPIINIYEMWLPTAKSAHETTYMCVIVCC